MGSIAEYNQSKFEEGNDDYKYVSSGYITWIWITMFIIYGLLAMGIKQTYCFYLAKRESPEPQEELARRYMAVTGVKWAFATQIVTLTSGAVGIFMWRNEQNRIYLEKNGDFFDENLASIEVSSTLGSRNKRLCPTKEIRNEVIIIREFKY